MHFDHVTSRRLTLGRITAMWAAIWMVVAILATGCDISNMEFVEDTRVRVVEPETRSTVTLPVTVRWEVTEFEVTGRDGQSSPDAGYFAVFVDRHPIPPGKTLEWYVQQDESCGDSPCGTVENLSDIYTTEKTELELSRLPAIDRGRAVEQHEAVVVLLDGTGARIGESAFAVRFTFEREA